ncbi:hypothetical protein BDZ91DRAFT_744062, partial [Kalaharituber pfeilii]
MAELNPHNILTPDLLLAIEIEITEYMLYFTMKLLCGHQHCKEKCVLIGGLFLSKPMASF